MSATTKATKSSESENIENGLLDKPPAIFSIGGAGGGIRTHGGLRQRILSPPPCPRFSFGPT